MKKTKLIAAALAVLFIFNTYAIPRSKAVVIDATAAFGAAAATAAINGTTATTLFAGMSTSAATTAMTTLMGEYAVSTGAAASGSAFAASIGAGTVISAAGAIVLTAAAAFAVYKFIGWLREEKGLEAGGDVVSFYDVSSFKLIDGSQAYVYDSFESAIVSPKYDSSVVSLDFVSGAYTRISPDSSRYRLIVYSSSGSHETSSIFNSDYIGYNFAFLPDYTKSLEAFVTISYYPDGTHMSEVWARPKGEIQSFFGSVLESASLQPNSEFQPIPAEIPDGQAMVISGIENLPQADPQAAADAIMQLAIDGDLNPNVSVENDPIVTPDPDPDPEPVPPPEGLPQNLPELGDVLISRFPFSIPWDIGRVLDFLSAEPVAPYIEFQPFKGDLFGIPAGSVSVDYDFSKHEDIASFCRTFEIVGFCLLLAVGTKRLIWTA